MSTEGPFWERHLGHMEETAYYGITTVAYFVAVMFGFAYQWVLLKSDSDTRMAGINVSIFFIVIQCALKAYGGFICVFAYAIAGMVSFYCLPGVAERIRDGPRKLKKKKTQ
ncbi:Oidioi.mRNA.OKI2018_I69.chr1.g2166.t1.cds [Oikopleura dioica]|uniref:Oidioi.mRNA.OKI2018_I69.chr1.g2166.t1.cds n=1 Tax=Oikopleura dioica TaxID=34765 RepID=A0ABN7SUG4_OIKDI|nr:Oidioi.mRNA.OKI2018_I69.chr1.g2166.t1.cds [Oikopleura dioica]